jgi:hypothetical protein
MTEQNKYEQVKKKAEERAKELFKPLPKEIEEEFEKESTLGSPENLVRPDNQDE